MPTIAQKKTFEEVQRQIANGQRPNIAAAQRTAGYAPSTIKKSTTLTKSKGWQQLMAQIDDTDLMQRVVDIALDTQDKRACLAAVDMLMKLKDRYPAGKLKVDQYDSELDALSD